MKKTIIFSIIFIAFTSFASQTLKSAGEKSTSTNYNGGYFTFCLSGLPTCDQCTKYKVSLYNYYTNALIGSCNISPAQVTCCTLSDTIGPGVYYVVLSCEGFTCRALEFSYSGEGDEKFYLECINCL